MVIVVFQFGTRLRGCAERVMAGSAGLIEDALAAGGSWRYGVLRDHRLWDDNGEKKNYRECEWCGGEDEFYADTSST